MKALAVLVVSWCWLLAASQHEVEEPSVTIPPCEVSHDTLDTLFEDLLPGLEVVVNCLSFDATGALSAGVVSGINETGDSGVGEMRFVLSCVQEVLTARSSSLAPSSVEMDSTACVECADTATPCTTSKFIRAAHTPCTTANSVYMCYPVGHGMYIYYSMQAAHVQYLTVHFASLRTSVGCAHDL